MQFSKKLLNWTGCAVALLLVPPYVYSINDINPWSLYEYIDPNGNRRTIDSISESNFIENFISENYPAFETEIDEKIIDSNGNHLAIFCQEGKLFTPNIVWTLANIGEWTSNIVILQECNKRWYRRSSEYSNWELTYKEKFTSRTIREPEKLGWYSKHAMDFNWSRQLSV